jgi:tetratricopeptide (TPR) repeat protein
MTDDQSTSAAEAAYKRAMLQHSAGNIQESMVALEQALQLGYPPAILTVGSIEYQRQEPARGKQFFMSLLDLPAETDNLCEIIEEAGSFLISRNELADALELYQDASGKFPDVGMFHQRTAQCAAQVGMYDEAIAAAERAIELEPGNSGYVSDLGWTFVLAERYNEAETAFLRALEIDASNENARANLAYCRDMMREPTRPGSDPPA